MELVKLTKTESLISQSDIFPCKIGKIYSITCEVIGIKGKPYTSYLGVINLDKKNQEIERKIEWLNDFSGTKKTINFHFRAQSDRMVVIYRINNETKIKSDCEYKITPTNKISILEVPSHLEINFKSIDSSTIPKNFSQEKALKRWKTSAPNSSLTWGKILTGDAFIDLAEKHNIFSTEKSILELGTGYGRILSSILLKKIPFRYYTGVDISSKNIESLEAKFANKNINFVKGDFSTVVLDKKYDVVISSAVLKHQFPTFYEALKNIQQFVVKGGIFFFDLRENLNIHTGKRLDDLLQLGPEKSNWEESSKTFVGFYTQKEVRTLLEHLNQELLDTDYVVHDKKVGERLVIISKTL